MVSPDQLLAQLEDIGREEVMYRLHNLYSVSDDTEKRRRILEILNQLRDDRHFKEIENYFLSDEDPGVRIEAAKILAFHYNKTKAIKPLIYVFEKEKNLQIKYTALRLLVALGHRKEYTSLIVKTLKETLHSEDDKLVQEAAESLGILKEQSAVEELLKVAQSRNLSVRARAIQALGEIKDEKAVPLLLRHLGSASYDVWNSTFNALVKILGKGTFNHILKMFKKANQYPKDVDYGFIRKGAIRAFAELGKKEIISLLIKSLGDYFYWVRWEAINALDQLEPNWREIHKQKLYNYNLEIRR